MPSIFELFGTINLDTRAFDGSIKSIGSKLETADGQLNKVISTSNRLGDTSATVAQRYNKLSDAISVQRQKLIDNALAFEKGEISAKKFAAVVTQVDRVTNSLTSRIKDATARATELDETGLTHFQNQIKGATADLEKMVFVQQKATSNIGLSFKNENEGGHSLFNLNNARPFQGLGPAFQATGLRKYGVDETIANVLTVAARQTGLIQTQLVNAATAETELATSAKVVDTTVAASVNKMLAMRAGAEGVQLAAAETAGSAQATTAAFTETTVVLGASLATLGTIAAIIGIAVGDFFLIRKEINTIEEKGKERLKTEEAIAGAINKQYLAAQNLQNELGKQQGQRDFERELNTYGNLPGAQKQLQDLHDRDAKELADKMSNLDASLLRSGITDNNYRTQEQAKLIPPGYAELQADREAKIKALAKKIDENKHADDKSSIDLYRSAQKTQVDAFWADEKAAAKKAAEDQKKDQEDAKKLIEQGNKEETSALQNNYKTQEALLKQHLAVTGASQAAGIAAQATLQTKEIDAQIDSTKRYYNALAANAKDATERAQAESNKRIAIGQLETQRQIANIEKIQKLQEIYSNRFGTNLEISDLRTKAAEFRQGYNNPTGTVAEELQRKLDALTQGIGTTKVFNGFVSGGSLPTTALFREIANVSKLSPDDLKKYDEQVIKLTDNLNPKDLSEDQRNLADVSRRREADRLQTGIKDALDQLNTNLATGNLVTFRDESGSVKSITKGTPADTAQRY